jgi:hypothetical protein
VVVSTNQVANEKKTKKSAKCKICSVENSVGNNRRVLVVLLYAALGFARNSIRLCFAKLLHLNKTAAFTHNNIILETVTQTKLVSEVYIFMRKRILHLKSL